MTRKKRTSFTYTPETGRLTVSGVIGTIDGKRQYGKVVVTESILRTDYTLTQEEEIKHRHIYHCMTLGNLSEVKR